MRKAVVFALMLAGCATANPATLTPDHFLATSSLDDDNLAVTATITTLNGFHSPAAFGTEDGNGFLRANVNKQTGETTYQLYQIIYYSGDWRFYSRVNYELGGTVLTEPVREIDRSVLGCFARTGCSLREDVALDVSDRMLRAIAARETPWRFKFTGRSGPDFFAEMWPAEAAGILLAVERYQAGK